MRLRVATLADAPAIAPLLGELGYPSTITDVERRLAALATSDSGQVWVAVDDDGMVGVAHVNLLPVLHSNDRFAQLVLIVVAERARRRGVGRALADACEDWAAERGCSRILVTSGEERHDAHSFYQAIGYQYYARRFSKAVPRR